MGVICQIESTLQLERHDGASLGFRAVEPSFVGKARREELDFFFILPTSSPRRGPRPLVTGPADADHASLGISEAEGVGSKCQCEGSPGDCTGQGAEMWLTCALYL